MPRDEQRTNLILIAGALILALLVGLVIPLASGSQPGQKAQPWTPPVVSSTPTRRLPTPSATLPAPTQTPTNTPKPTNTVEIKPTPPPTVAATPSTVPASPTAAPTRPPTTLPASPAPSPTAAAAAAPIATVRQGPLIARPSPSKDTPIFALVQVGDTFTVTARTADSVWLQVCCVKDAAVWLAAEFVDVNGDVTGLPVSP